jgi:hypothetical protein
MAMGISSSNPALACLLPAPMDLHDVLRADAVVVGDIRNYELVLDPEIRRRHQEARDGSPASPGGLRDTPRRFITDYARFDIQVFEVLSGTVSARTTITATWDNSTFGEPDEISGMYLVALRDAQSLTPPLRGPSATMFPTPEPELLTVLQAPCASAFLFERDSDFARAIRQIMDGEGDAEMEIEVFSKFLYLNGAY